MDSLLVGGKPTCGASKVYLREVNDHLICVLCEGYYIDAVTIGECLHSFCRSCIVKYLQTNKFCPVCEVQLHKTRPLLSVRTDKILQRLVFKMVPGLYSREMQRRKNFYSNTELQSSTDSESCDGFQDYKLGQEYFSPEDSISLSLEYYDSTASRDTESEPDATKEDKKQIPYRRYLQCPAAVTMNHLMKFVRMKYGLTKDQPVDIIYEDERLPENFSLMDVAYTFTWKRVTPMRFYYRILERSSIATLAINHKVTAQVHPTNSQLGTSMDPEVVSENDEVQKQGQGESFSGETVQDKRKLEDSSDVSEINSVPQVLEAEPPLKKAKRISEVKKKTCDNNNDIIYLAEDSEDSCSKNGKLKKLPTGNAEKQLLQETNDSDENFANDVDENPVDDEEAGDEVTNGESEVIDIDEVVQESQDGMNEADDDVTNGESEVIDIDEVVQESQDGMNEAEELPSEDFILQDDQQMDINDDLEEDDDEDRLRICEDLSVEDKNVEDDQGDENLQAQEIQEQKVAEEKAEDVPKYNEFKIRKKNKKAKHHHHHRHKRDHPPAATILHSSDSKKDIMKLKVKLTAIKQDESSKHYYIENNHSPRHSSKLKSYVICEDNDTISNSHSNQSQENIDDDSGNSQMTDERDVDTQSVASSKEGHVSSEDNGQVTRTSSSNQNGSAEVGKNKIRESSTNKERLLQMRAVRHKNITKHKEILNSNNTNNDGGKPKTQILVPPSSITVSKITAAEKRKMDEEKLLMLSGKGNNHENHNKRPSLEIMLVNAPKAGPKNCDTNMNDRTNIEKRIHNSIRNHLPTIPLVRIMKTTAPAPTLYQCPPTSTSASSKATNNMKMASKNTSATDNKHKLQDTSSDNKSTLDKLQSFTQSEKKPGKQDDFGALDLSGKSSRKTFSSPLTSEKTNSSNQNVLNMAQSLVNRQFSNANSSPVRRASSNSPSDISRSRASPDPTRTIIPAAMWNLMTLSDTAVQISNMKAAHDGSKPHIALTNAFKKSASNHYPSVPSPSRSPSNSSPTQLKIPVPNLTLNNKNLLNKTRSPGNDIASAGRGRGIGIQNRNISVSKPLINHDPVKCVRPVSVSPGRSANSIMNRQNPSSAVAKKQAGINGRSLGIPPPPPAIPISSIFKMENMTRKYDIEKVAAGLTVKAAVDTYRGVK